MNIYFVSFAFRVGKEIGYGNGDFPIMREMDRNNLNIIRDALTEDGMQDVMILSFIKYE